MSEYNLKQLDVPLERDIFLRTLIRELSGALEDIIGIDQAHGFVSIVGQNMGEWINQHYLTALNTDKLSPEQVAAVLVDLKARIKGDFYLISQDNDKIVLGNRACPFAEKVKDRTSLCMMTSNVFGYITSQNLGYAKVSLDQTIATGDSQCHVTIYLNQSTESQGKDGNEYYAT